MDFLYLYTMKASINYSDTPSFDIYSYGSGLLELPILLAFAPYNHLKPTLCCELLYTEVACEMGVSGKDSRGSSHFLDIFGHNSAIS